LCCQCYRSGGSQIAARTGGLRRRGGILAEAEVGLASWGYEEFIDPFDGAGLIGDGSLQLASPGFLVEKGA